MPAPGPSRAAAASGALGEGLAELVDVALEMADDRLLEQLLDRLLAAGRMEAPSGHVRRAQLGQPAVVAGRPGRDPGDELADRAATGRAR